MFLSTWRPLLRQCLRTGSVLSQPYPGQHLFCCALLAIHMADRPFCGGGGATDHVMNCIPHWSRVGLLFSAVNSTHSTIGGKEWPLNDAHWHAGNSWPWAMMLHLFSKCTCKVQGAVSKRGVHKTPLWRCWYHTGILWFFIAAAQRLLFAQIPNFSLLLSAHDIAWNRAIVSQQVAPVKF